MPDTIRLLHITDTHLHAHPEAQMRGVNTYHTLRNIIERIKNGKRQPDAVIATGDLVQDETRQGYEVFHELVSKLDATVHCIPGNHDSQRIMQETLGEQPFQYCGHAIYGNWCLAMLNSVIRLEDSGRLEQAELDRLEHLLQDNPDQHVMACTHHQPYQMGSRWLDGVGLNNGSELLELARRYDNLRCLTWGHVHQESDRDIDGLRMISTPSTGSQFLPHAEDFAVDNKPPGFRWIELLPDGGIETEVIWLT